MNNIQILATLTRDCEIRYTQSGTAIASFSIAQNEKRKNAQGVYEDYTHFFECTAFSKTAENINTYFQKGSRILINGSLDYQSWTDSDGKKRSKIGIKVREFDFIDKKPVYTVETQKAPDVPYSGEDDEEIPFARIGLQYKYEAFLR